MDCVIKTESSESETLIVSDEVRPKWWILFGGNGFRSVVSVDITETT